MGGDSSGLNGAGKAELHGDVGWGGKSPGSGDDLASCQSAKGILEEEKLLEYTKIWGGTRVGEEEEQRRGAGV